MAWLARSIANSLKLDDDEEDEKQNRKPGSVADDVSDQHYSENDWNQPPSSANPRLSSSSKADTPRGVKEDLSELTKTLRSQFWGVASFLAPPPVLLDRLEEHGHPSDQLEHGQPSDHQDENRSSSDSEEEDVIAGIRSDFAEIGGRFRTGISKFSSNIAVSEFTKIASNLLQLGSEEEIPNNYEVGNAIGATEEVVAFARDIAEHPETWLDFPFPDEDEAFDDFSMTDAQQEHAFMVERLAPRLASLRIELCPGYMSESCFWKIYFVLLHPKLSKHDVLFLSTPQVLEARALLSHEFHKRNKATVQADTSGINISETQPHAEPLSGPTESLPVKVISVEAPSSTNSSDSETEKHLIQSNEMQIIDKSVIEGKPVHQDKPHNPPTESSRVLDMKSNDDDGVDDWLKEEDTSESVGVVGSRTIALRNDEDVSFSDLEDDVDDMPVSYKRMTSGPDSLAKDSPEWVQFKDMKPVSEQHVASGQVSETKESNDWLDVKNIDVM